MANVNCPLCKGAVWIPAEKAETISPEELAKVIHRNDPDAVSCDWEKEHEEAKDYYRKIAAAILEKYKEERR